MAGKKEGTMSTPFSKLFSFGESKPRGSKGSSGSVVGRTPAPRQPSYGRSSKGRFMANVLYLQDTSSSVGQDALDVVFPSGVQTIAKELRTSLPAEFDAMLCAMSFATETETVLPFSQVSNLNDRLDLPKVEARGVTNMEDALWEAFFTIDNLKKEQDDAHIPRAGSLLVIATDGKPTDGNGTLSNLSPELVDEIAERNRTRRTNTLAIGIGQVDDETLLQLGPADTSQGTPIPRAVRYLGEASDAECWKAICKLVGQASSSATGKPVLAYQGADADWLGDLDADIIELDPSQYRLVV